MRIALLGAGAVGLGFIARLIRGGAEVRLVARGETLAALQRDGLTLTDADDRALERLPVTATDDPATLGPQDVVLVAVKAHALVAALPALAPLLGPHTVVVPMVNGVPWWYAYRAGDLPFTHLDSVDPGGAVWQAIGPERAVGCIVRVAARRTAPGSVHAEGGRLVLGEPDGMMSDRLKRIAGYFQAHGVGAEMTPDIRAEVWRKIWGNLVTSPTGLLTGATVGEILSEERLQPLLLALLREADAVGRAIGATVDDDPMARLSPPPGAMFHHRSSMLQDLDAGRSVELDPIVGAIGEIGRRVGVPTPTVDIVYGLARQRAAHAGCFEPIPGSR